MDPFVLTDYKVTGDFPLSKEPLSVDFGVVLCTPDSDMKEALDAAIAAVSSLKLVGMRDTSTKRSIYAATQGRVIVNTPAPHMLKVLGPHFMVCALRVNGDPKNAADTFALTIEQYGIRAKSYHEIEPEIPVLSFVTIEAMPFVAFVMWPTEAPANVPPIVPKD